MSLEELSTKLESYNQQHLIKFWNDLASNEKECLENEIKQTDFESLFKLFQETKKDKLENKVNQNLKPVSSSSKSSVEKTSEKQLEKYEARGLKAIADGQVAVILLAGGQASRLG